MRAPYPFHAVIEETLIEVFEKLIRKSIGELPLSFEKCLENGYTPYIINNTKEVQFALLYFSYDNLNFEVHLKRFLGIVKKLRQKDEVHFSASAIGIGLCELGTVKELMKTGTDFQMVSDQHFMDSFHEYGITLNKDLTMDIDSYIRYQNLSIEEKRELSEILLDGIQNGIAQLIKGITKSQSILYTTASNTESL